MSDAIIYNGRDGTAGGAAFGSAIAQLAGEREVSHEHLARELGMDEDTFARVLSGEHRLGVGGLAVLTHALRLHPIEFLQRSGILGLSAYAYGLDPLYFLPEGQVRYDARIYMREINPRHQVPERDMTRRNLTLKAVGEDDLLDERGRLELTLAYLLRTAVQQTGGTL